MKTEPSPSTGSETELWKALETVIDPELGSNLVELGLIYDLQLDDGEVRIRMTATSPGCPMLENLREGVEVALLNTGVVNRATVEWVWDPPWHPSMMNTNGNSMR